MNQRARLLRGENLGFGVEPFRPALGNDIRRSDLIRQLEEDFVMAHFGGEKGVVELGEFGVVFSSRFGEDGEAFAGSGFNQSRDTEPIEEFVGATVANTGAEIAGVSGFVRADEAAAPFDEYPGDLSEMGGFVAGDAGHGFHPAGEPDVGPAGHEVHGVLSGFHLEEGMVVEERDGVGERGVGPGERGTGAEWKGVDGYGGQISG